MNILHLFINFIDLNNLYFYITWSRKCKTLILTATKISKLWCQHVINNCDCSEIKSITLHVGFKDFKDIKDCEESLTTTTTTEDKSKLLLLKLAQQFKHVQNLKLFLGDINDNTLYFLVSLCKIVSKNNGSNIEINLCNDTDVISAMQWFTCTNNIKVDVLSIYLNHHTAKLFETIGTQMSDLKHIKIKQSMSFAQHVHEINFDKIKTNCNFFPSLKVIEYEHGSYVPMVSELDEFLNSKVILQWAKNDILVIFDVRCNVYRPRDPTSNLRDIFAFLYSLLIEQSVLIDIRIQFNSRSWDFTRIEDKYWSYFNREKMIKEYKAPRLNEKQNKYYQPLINPNVTFVADADENVFCLDIRVANACLLDLCKDTKPTVK